MSRISLLSVARAAVGWLTACDEGDETLRAFKVSDRAELIGGPGAVGQVGDFVLENNQLRAVVLGARREDHSAGPGLFGGSLVDLDLRRSEAEFRAGRGLDSLAEVIPMVNLLFPNPPDLGVRVISDGSDGTEARVRVTASEDYLFEALRLVLAPPSGGGILSALFPELQGQLCLRTDYVVRPGERFVEITTVATVRPSGTPYDADQPHPCEFDFDPDDVRPMTMARPGQPMDPLFNSLLGDKRGMSIPNDAEEVYWPGLLAGDFIYFGHTTSSFAPGMGYDKQRTWQRMMDAGENTFVTPMRFPVVMGTGDRVSYAMSTAGDGELLVPLFLSSATAMLSGMVRCEQSPDDDAACDSIQHWSFTRFVAVGDGDAASAAEPLHDMRGDPLGTLKGGVFDARTGKPLPHAKVFLIERPTDLGAGEAQALREGRLPYDRLVEHLRSRPGNAGRAPGILTQINADPGTDVQLDGGFEARVPTGTYAVAAFVPGRTPSAPVAVEVRRDATSTRNLFVPAPGHLEVEVYDERGRHVPAKVTVLAVEGGAKARPELGDPLLPDLEYAPDGNTPDRRVRDAIYRVTWAAHGKASLDLPAPGTYEVVVSRGFEYEVHRERVVDLRPGFTRRVLAVVVRSVDTTGWVSADGHVHANPSFDSSTSMELRAITMAAEGVEVLVATDHDVVSDYQPVIRELGLERVLTSEPGVETTTLELGHFLAFPLRYDFTKAPQHNAPDWVQLHPAIVMARMRKAGSLGAERTVVTIPHPRDGFFGYFDQIGLSPYTMGVSVPTFSAGNRQLKKGRPSCAFDAIEVLNGKRYELIRTPTVAEARAFARARKKLEGEHRWGEPGVARAVNERFTRRMLERTPDEQQAWIETRSAPACELADLDDVTLDTLVPCGDHEGTVDDWFALLDAGLPGERGAPEHSVLLAPTGMANSDTHGKTDVESGFPRNWIAASTDVVSRVDHGEIADNTRARRVTAGAGPFVELWVNGAPIGSLVEARGAVTVRVRVQSPAWFLVDRVELYRSKELVRLFELQEDRTWRFGTYEAGGLVEERFLDASAAGRSGAVDLDVTFEDDMGARDVWYVAMALGLDPFESPMAPVYTSVPLPSLQFSDIILGALGNIQIASALFSEGPQVPRFGTIWPFSFTNPVWVDGDGVDDEGRTWTPARTAMFCQEPPEDDLEAEEGTPTEEREDGLAADLPPAQPATGRDALKLLATALGRYLAQVLPHTGR